MYQVQNDILLTKRNAFKKRLAEYKAIQAKALKACTVAETSTHDLVVKHEKLLVVFTKLTAATCSLEHLILADIVASGNFAVAFKAWLELLSVKQVQIAEILDVHSSVVSDYVGGRRIQPGIGVVSKFVAALIVADKSSLNVLDEFSKELGVLNV